VSSCHCAHISTAKPGKYGHPKTSITGIDIFNGKKLEDSLPSSHNVEVPVIKRTEWQAISVDEDGYLTLMTTKGETRQDLKLPDDTEDDAVVSQRITKGLDEGKEIMVTVLSALGIEKVSEVSEK
jgi:translation initiation factor 5A